jgi:hypothetical protein
VDTCAGQPVSGMSAQQFSIEEDGAAVSPYESQQTIQAKSQNYQMYSLLLLDLSGSILESGAFDSLTQAANLYVDQVLGNGQNGQQIAIYSFDGRPELNPVVGFTSDPGALKSGIAGLATRQCTTDGDCAAFPDHRTCAAWMCVDNSTNLNGAVVGGINLLEGQLQANAAVQFKDAAMVLMTDGSDEAARVSAATAQGKVNGSQVHVFTVGLAGEVDSQALRSFGKDGYVSAQNASQLGQAFTDIANRIVALSSRFYLLEYCSPKRNGSHQLTLNAAWTGPDKKTWNGSLSKTFDATGFQSGCQL